MERGDNYACTNSSKGWRGSLLSIPSPYTPHLQIKAEARYLIFCDAPPLFLLTRMFGNIPLVYLSLQPGPVQGIDQGSGGPHAENLLPQV